ncbi:DUF2520 domain-containing protein [Croceitalea sp. MTPC9]|uniref:Rossmann-like and DUF2520 domain-containing protein n=1 Tax=unclassified Croceitalea TaxID=2632280 RepID=UPI002B3DC456|nr:DUF2520 domain-containing protein [Croceitalea sp. MTPC6]GMN15915.1 DUF2520 domain-containing protein [Croceitalea sp. MTPC9]
MFSIVLLGTGNVAHHLFDIFQLQKDIQVKQVFGRSSNALSHFSIKCDTTTNTKHIIDADIYIIAVSDSSIAKVSELLLDKNGLVVHTSGSVPMNAIKSKDRGVFYPLQTFTKDKKVDFSEIPICVEANSDKDLKTLKLLAGKISSSINEISSLKRKKLHLAAVFANNFTNHMYSIASEICAEENLPFDLLKSLIEETTDKLRFLSPGEAQTGPAKRNDVFTMKNHLQELANPMHKKLYQLLSESIKS